MKYNLKVCYFRKFQCWEFKVNYRVGPSKNFYIIWALLGNTKYLAESTYERKEKRVRLTITSLWDCIYHVYLVQRLSCSIVLVFVWSVVGLLLWVFFFFFVYCFCFIFGRGGGSMYNYFSSTKSQKFLWIYLNNDYTTELWIIILWMRNHLRVTY